MANPNLLNMTSVLGKSVPFILTTAGAEVLANSSSSSVALKINSLIVAHTLPTGSATVTVEFVRNTVAYKIVSAVSVDAGSSLVIFGKDTSIYLEPGDTIKCSASANNTLTGILSYEILQ